MARLPYLSRNDLPEADRSIWDDFVRVRGTEPGNIHRVVANSPNLLRRFVDLANELRNGTELDARLRELALLTVGHLTVPTTNLFTIGIWRCGWASGANSLTNWQISSRPANSIRKSARLCAMLRRLLAKSKSVTPLSTPCALFSTIAASWNWR